MHAVFYISICVYCGSVYKQTIVIASLPLYLQMAFSLRQICLPAIWLPLSCVQRTDYIISIKYISVICERFFYLFREQITFSWFRWIIFRTFLKDFYLFLFLSENVRLLCVQARVDVGRLHCWKWSVIVWEWGNLMSEKVKLKMKVNWKWKWSVIVWKWGN